LVVISEACCRDTEVIVIGADDVPDLLIVTGLALSYEPVSTNTVSPATAAFTPAWTVQNGTA
jgi:hypothetical protein